MKQHLLHCLYSRMVMDSRIWVVTGDVGFGSLDLIKDGFPSRFLNPGAAEQAIIGISVGLALSGKIPFCYSITPFLIYRPFEWIRNYLNYEKIPVKLIGTGLDEDYFELGQSHHCREIKQVLACVPNIKTFFPNNKSEAELALKCACENNLPTFIGLKRVLPKDNSAAAFA